MPKFRLAPLDPTDIAWGVEVGSLDVEAPNEESARRRAAALTLRGLRRRRLGRIPAHLPWLFFTASICTVAPSDNEPHESSGAT